MEQGNYVARCFSMIQIGTVEETYLGESKTVNKIRLAWEFPTEKAVFSPEKGEEPFVLGKEYSFSMHEKATFRKDLGSWRGKTFTDEEAAKFDAGKLLGVPCMINVIHHTTAKGETIAKIGSIAPLPKGLTCPDQINPTQALSFADFDFGVFDKLPGWIQEKIKSSKEYAALVNPAPATQNTAFDYTPVGEDEALPF
ncbi:hypothetical protein DYU11_20225 [Fibrisoma montanum]|uniref:Uncharacterized protein n=2 Tax=Fibrisoma montanum TaxID=2305895 RepID=A0A418M3Q7_9BACT|nr:hypothetical protein DYU11_20225 [Fibrisoma montanum]